MGKTITNCGNCKKTHLEGSCPGKGIKCKRCGKMGHFPDCCGAQWKSNNAVFKVASVGDEEPLLKLETVINSEVAKKITDPTITVNLKLVNRYVKRLGYPTQVPAEEIVDIPPGMKFFTVLNRRHGYWQATLSEESKHYTCFILPWGLYRFKCNIMGLISGGHKHNLQGDKALEGMEIMKKIRS